MSLNTLQYDLAPIFERAMRAAAPSERRGIRRAFRRAIRAARERSDLRPAVLLAYRYP